MGRKKSTPQQRAEVDNSAEYLGTYGVVATDINNNVEATNQQQQQQQQQQNDTTNQNNLNSVRATASRRRTNDQSNNDPQDGTAATTTATDNNKKKVAFPKAVVTEVVEAESPPEIEIILESKIVCSSTVLEIDNEDNSVPELDSAPAPNNVANEVNYAKGNDDSSMIIIHYNYRHQHQQHKQSTTETTATVKNETDILLRTFRMVNNSDETIRLEVTVPTEGESAAPLIAPPYQIITAKGAATLIQFCLGRPDNHDGDNDTRKQQQQQQQQFSVEAKDIGMAVEHGLLRLTIIEQSQQSQQYEVNLALTQQAFESCRPAFLPVKSSKASKVYQAALCLQRALAELYPNHKELFPAVPTIHSKNQRAITAKEIYALVDNVQLKASLDRKQHAEGVDYIATDTTSGGLKIPGLVPTLRPYQEAAVRWMLERERGSSADSSTQQSKSDEWELAWVVVHSYASKTIVEPSYKPRVIFLPEFKQQHPELIRLQKDPSRFYYCPYTCWLATTLEEAKAMTLNGRSAKNAQDPYSFRGGILAESMGLGKTCELLACILANPDPEQQSTSVVLQDEPRVPVVSSSSSSSSVSSGMSSVDSELARGTGKGADNRGIDDNSMVLADDRHIISASDSEQDATFATPTIPEDSWIDDNEHELGACICGKSISIFPSPATDSIVLCCNCREPMHWDCAAYESERNQLPQLSTGAILFRKRFSEEAFSCKLCPESFCPCCLAEKASTKSDDGTTTKIRSRATVIVTPPAIQSQWEREIRRHTRSADGSNQLKVVQYPGVRNLLRNGKRKNDSFRLLHPRVLADADIILVTFDALRHDLGHSNSNPFTAGAERTSLRKRKRYRVVPSPLSSISWWRVCLDEAQRIETPTAGSAQMALKLDANFRWAVSGTPIGHGKLEDLFGLLLFLQVTAPFNNKDWFGQCLSSTGNGSYLGKRLQHLLQSVFWRSTKAFDAVAQQMGVPPQVELKTLLKFSSVERHFYNRQLETTLEIATDMSQQQTRKRKGGNGNFDVLARQLHKLRAACCHPSVGLHGLAKKTGSSDGVLSMDEVLDRLIDDAKNQCEEALRVALFNSNPMAAIARLKVEARQHHQIATITENDEFLCSQSCQLYQEALDLADKNASPSLVVGDAILSGTRGFQSPQKHVRGGKALLEWQILGGNDQDTTSSRYSALNVWASFDFQLQAKKMCQIRLRTVGSLPYKLTNVDGVIPFDWRLRYPRECVLQVSNPAVGGEYVGILSFSLPEPVLGDATDSSWVVHGGFWIYRSKLWRIVVNSFHGEAQKVNFECAHGDYFGIEVELFEPSIGSDSLQRLHTLHNAAISFREFQSVKSNTWSDRVVIDSLQEKKLPLDLSMEEIAERILSMERDVARIEQYHLGYAKTLRSKCLKHLDFASSNRKHLELELFNISNSHKGAKPKRFGFWDVTWWEDALVAARLSGTPTEQFALCEKVTEAISECSGTSRAFPAFQDLHGMHVALKLRLEDSLSNIVDGKYNQCIQSVSEMSPDPTGPEVLENQVCGVCKEDWGQIGPKCRHCKVGDDLKELNMDNYKLEKAILDAIWKWSRSSRSGVRNSNTYKDVTKVATKFFEVCEAAGKEVLAASRLWRTQLDYLNVLDELNSSKTSMRLTLDGEDVSGLTEEQKGSVIVPIDIFTRYDNHAMKQAGALGHLRRHKETLTFLRNQISTQGESSSKDADTCMVCLSDFNNDRAVLACGHSFHMTPCIEQLKKISGGSRAIACPLRCTVRTKYEDILIASEKRRDDGSQSTRKVMGSWGTKVTAIVSDLLAVSDLGEKSIVFSMWEDMLGIMEEALAANGVGFVRASSLARIGEATKSFRASDCFALLLNVKNGAEGLNLIEATHVFMIEPLLNCGLDSQATARCHRIGQTRKTTLHRYLIEDTIEMKVDKYRRQHQEEQLEDAIMDSRRCKIQAGGIDGGFSSKEELMDMLSLEI